MAAASSNSGPPTSGIRQTIVYSTQSVDLIAENAFGNTISTPKTRPRAQRCGITCGRMATTATADFYAYNSHYKPIPRPTTRHATCRRSDDNSHQCHARLDALGEGAHAIFAGDYNIFQQRTGVSNAHRARHRPGNDPINRIGTWNNNSTFADVHTQSPCASGLRCGTSAAWTIASTFNW